VHDPATLPLLEAAVAAVESEMRIRRLDQLTARLYRSRTASTAPRVSAPPVLSVLVSDVGRLLVGGRAAELSMRHSEILTLLAWHPGGLSVDRHAPCRDGAAA